MKFSFRKYILFSCALCLPYVVHAEPAYLSKTIRIVFTKAGLPTVNENRIPANWTLKTLSGETLTLHQLKGKVVFLNFWATWCPPCRAEMPSMEVLYRRFHGKGLEMIACDVMENSAEVAKFMRDNKLSFPALLDSTGQVSNQYGVQGIPATFIIDREGRIVSHVVGSKNWNTPAITDAFEALLQYGR
ncbi:MAG: TlpA family protein disulfide reductase [Spirochaetaceae bacterium]|jgi:peroxiredoxin|nr:TlpA family protein disulfide reductase [Spirochaetaceae bacterium]